MKQIPLPRIILGVFLLSLLYWIYLAGSTQMGMSCDAVGYEELGRLLQHQSFSAYLKGGPNREPIYPLLVALAMHVEYFSTIAYTKIMAIFGALILLLTQILMYALLRKLNVRTGICAIVLGYLGVSPALTNGAFSLYSEIAAYPIVLGIVLVSHSAWQAIQYNNKKTIIGYGSLLGALFTTATLVKGVFECVFPIYLIIFIAMAFFTYRRESAERLIPCILCTLTALSLFYVPITGYKWFNKHFNGNFVVTNRGPWALYGNTARRMEPLTFKRFLTALAYAPGEGVCKSLFGPQECDFWSFRKSDELGFQKIGELNNQHLSNRAVNDTLLHLSLKKATQNPAQYTLLTSIEGLKMFFWESTQIGFVIYPHWLNRIYEHTLFKNVLRLLIALLTLFAFFHCWFHACKHRQILLGFMLLLISLTITFYSFFFILTRYALPLAPLYLISIGYSINRLFIKDSSATQVR